MIPKTLSASSLHVAQLCLSRWHAEYFNKSPGMGNTAADTGSAVHGGLEEFVKATLPVKDLNPPDEYKPFEWEVLKAFYELSYMKVFNTGDFSTYEYKDGLALCRVWFDRTDVRDVVVLSCETKENFPVKTKAGEIPVNFIIDRLDKMGDNEYRVVDYKTIRWAPTYDQLRKKIQAKIYALAVRIKYPNAERIWVQFETLRHASPVEVLFSRDDNIDTWKQLKHAANRIIDTPETDPPEKLNAECRFCVRRQRCMTLRTNIVTGGVMSLSVDEAALKISQVKNQIAALEQSETELEGIISTYAKEMDLTEWKMDDGSLVELKAKPRRGADPDMVEKIIGSKLFNEHGKSSITMAAIEKLLKGTDLDPKQKAQLRGIIRTTYSEPTVYVTPPSPMEE